VGYFIGAMGTYIFGWNGLISTSKWSLVIINYALWYEFMGDIK
jgi:hypothetical protein